MEEADSLSLEIEENDLGNDLKEQIDQYNIYINFLNEIIIVIPSRNQ